MNLEKTPHKPKDTWEMQEYQVKMFATAVNLFRSVDSVKGSREAPGIFLKYLTHKHTIQIFTIAEHRGGRAETEAIEVKIELLNLICQPTK